MKTLITLTSLLVLAAGCASHQGQTSSTAYGAPPTPVTTEVAVQPQPATTQALVMQPGVTYTTAPQPGQQSGGWYILQSH